MQILGTREFAESACVELLQVEHSALLQIASCFLRTQAPNSNSSRLSEKAIFPPVAMFCGKRLRGLIPFFVLALSAVQAARVGLQPSALTPTQAGRRECRDIKRTATDEELRSYGVKKWHHMFRSKRCYCRGGFYPSNGCGEVEEVKGRQYTFPSFRLSAAYSSCRCLSGPDKVRGGRRALLRRRPGENQRVLEAPTDRSSEDFRPRGVGLDP